MALVTVPAEGAELKSCKDHGWASLHQQKWMPDPQQHHCGVWGCRENDAHSSLQWKKITLGCRKHNPSGKIMRASCFPSVKTVARTNHKNEQASGDSEAITQRGISKICSQENVAGLRVLSVKYQRIITCPSLPSLPFCCQHRAVAQQLGGYRHSSEEGLGVEAEAWTHRGSGRGWHRGGEQQR